MMRSLRTRLLTGTIGGMILLLILFSLLIYVVIRSALVKHFDASLASVAQILAASVEIDANGVEVDIEVQQMPEFTDPNHPMNFQIWDSDGQVISKSPLLGTNDLPRFHDSLGKPVFTAFLGPKDHPYRAAGTTFFPRIDTDEPSDVVQTIEQSLILVVTRDAYELYGQLSFLKWLLLGAACFIACLTLVIGAYVVRSGLRPLNTIAAEIAAIREDSLATRITTQHVPAEIAPIKSRLNELLSRLQASFDRERQFNADVAHELRTPLAGIRSTIEVALARNRDATEYQNALSDCLEVTKTMQSMVGNLLTIARLDAQQIGSHIEQVKIAKTIDSCWNSCSDKAHNRRITFDNRIDPKIAFEIDIQNLSIIISNLMENAVTYANEGGKIWVSACIKDDFIEVSISNTGCQLTTEQVSHVFDCFWRSETSRSDVGVHCGLGLALVRKLTRTLGGYITAELQAENIFSVQLNLPLSPK